MFNEIQVFINHNSVEGAGNEEFLHHIMEDSQEITEGLNIFSPAIYALFYACSVNNLDFISRALQVEGVDEILSKCENKLFGGKNLFQAAAETGSIDLVQTLIDARWGIKMMYREDRDPIYYAVLNNRAEITQLLLENSPQIINKRYENGRGLLHIAALGNSPQTTDLLLENGADSNRIDFNRRTPLHYSALHNHPNVANSLLAKKASVFKKDDQDQKPSDLAADGSVVKIILQERENVEINQANQTVFALAIPGSSPRFAGGNSLPSDVLMKIRSALTGRN
jgi:ankyrin repeat protein